MPTRTYRSLQAGRAIAALLVVVHHSTYFLGIPPQLWHRPEVFNRFAGLRLGVEFFFVLSGVVIFMAHEKDLGHPEKVGIYAGKRFRRIYPIYWIVLVAWLPLYALFSRQTEPQLWFFTTILSSFLLVHLRDMQNDLVVSWTLFHEVLFYAFFALAIVQKRLGLLLIGLWVGLSVAGMNAHSPLMREYLFSPLHVLFVEGMIVSLLLRRSSIPAAKLVFLVGLLGLAACVISAPRFGNEGLGITQAAGLATAALLLGAMQLERDGQLSVPSGITFLGDASYAIYLIHMPAMVVLCKFVFPLWKSHGLSIVMCGALLSLGGLGAGILLHLALERPLLKLLSGRREAPPKGAYAASLP